MNVLTPTQLATHFRRIAVKGADNQEQQELIAEAMLLARAMQIEFACVVREPSFIEEFAKTVRLRLVDGRVK